MCVHSQTVSYKHVINFCPEWGIHVQIMWACLMYLLRAIPSGVYMTNQPTMATVQLDCNIMWHNMHMHAPYSIRERLCVTSSPIETSDKIHFRIWHQQARLGAQFKCMPHSSHSYCSSRISVQMDASPLGLYTIAILVCEGMQR